MYFVQPLCPCSDHRRGADHTEEQQNRGGSHECVCYKCLWSLCSGESLLHIRCVMHSGMMQQLVSPGADAACWYQFYVSPKVVVKCSFPVILKILVSLCYSHTDFPVSATEWGPFVGHAVDFLCWCVFPVFATQLGPSVNYIVGSVC